jgi:hypothetical protein
MIYKKIKFNKYIIKYTPDFNQLYIYNKINSLLNYKLDINKLHLSLVYLHINPKILKKFININKLEDYCYSVLKNIKIYPTSERDVIKSLSDVFAIIYKSSYELQSALLKIHLYIIKIITDKLKRSNTTYISRYKCEKDGGVWLYIDVINKNVTTSIAKIRIDNLLPHISFSIYSLSKNTNPINVHDIRKIYRNNKLRKDISKSYISLKKGYITFS